MGAVREIDRDASTCGTEMTREAAAAALGRTTNIVMDTALIRSRFQSFRPRAIWSEVEVWD